MVDRAKIGFVTGLVAEARWLRGQGYVVAIGGGTPAGAARAATELADRGAEALVSFGLAGALDPALRPGALLIPVQFVAVEGRIDCDPVLLEWLGGTTVARLAAAPDAVAAAAAKAALFQTSGAAAVDLESYAMAEVALARGLPAAALRAVADPAWRDLPPAALIALDAVGSVGLRRVIGSVLRQPAQLPDLLALACDAQQARATLRHRLRKLQP